MWNNLNGAVLVKDTTKKFYNKYLNKIVVYCPVARVIHDKKNTQSIQDAVDVRIERHNYLRKVYSHQYIQSYRIEDCNILQLEELYKIKLGSAITGVKIRIEEPYVSVYSNNVDELYEIAQSLDIKRLIEVHVPQCHSAVEILNRGEIVAKSKPEFPYKIILKENWNLDKATKQSLADYLYNLGDDQICLTKGLNRHLGDSTRTWFPGGYFYAKDDKIVTFVSLIAPGIVSGIFKLTNIE